MEAHGMHMVPMDGDVYDRLTDVSDIDVCWSLMRERIGRLLFGDMYVTVPFLTSADFFSQYFVFTKRRTIMDAIRRRRPVYEVIGNLEFMIDRRRSTWFPQFDFSQWDVNDANVLYSDYQFHLLSASNVEVPKSFEVIFRKPRVRAVNIPLDETIVINRQSVLHNDLTKVKYLYVITEVVLASFAHVLVRIGTQQTLVQYDRDIPIAFKYKKYKIRNDGTFTSEMETEMKYNDRVANWLRPVDQPIPRPQLYNRDKIERKNRTVLTLTKREGAQNNTNSVTGSFHGRTSMARFYRTLRTRHPIVDEAAREYIYQALQRHRVQIERTENDNVNNGEADDEEHDGQNVVNL